MGGRQEDLQKAPEPASWSTAWGAVAETGEALPLNRRGLAPKSGVSLKTQIDLLENYCGLRTWLSLSRLLVVEDGRPEFDPPEPTFKKPGTVAFACNLSAG